MFQRSGSAAEPVRLHLVKSFCLPLLTYCLGALTLPKYVLQQLCICWNDAYRKIFQYKRYESVKQLQLFCGDLRFDYMYDNVKNSV